MGPISLIAVNTFKETIRNKILYNILLFAAVIIVLSISFGEWSVFARVQVMEDFGLATMSISGLLLAVFIGVAMLGKEVTSKTVYHLAAKPVPRYTIVIGKYIGLCTTLALNFFLMSLFLCIMLYTISGSLNLNIIYAIILTACEMFIIVAVALLFSTLTTATLSALLTIAFYIIGHFNTLLELEFIPQMNKAFTVFLKLLYYTIPNLEHFNIRTLVVFDLALPDNFVFLALIYAILYIVLFCIISCVIFSRKDL